MMQLKVIMHANCDRRQNLRSSSYSLHKLLCLCAKGFVTKELLDLHCWMNCKTLQPTSSSNWCVSHILGSVYHWLVMYWESCIKRKDCHYITSSIGYWGKGLTVCWYQVLRFLLLVTACFDNSRFSGVMTLNSPGEVLPRWFSPFINKSSVSNLVSTAFNLVGDLFVLP